MAYPPPIPPSNRTDATPQATNHPGDHNTISRALTDIVNELGPDPSSPAKTVQGRIGQLENHAILDNAPNLQEMDGSLQAPQMYVVESPNGDNALTNKAYVDAKVASPGTIDGNVTIAPDHHLRVGGNPLSPDYAPGVEIATSGSFASTAAFDLIGKPSVYVNRAGPNATDAGEVFVRFLRNQVGIGSITIASGTSVAFNTSSDPRLKEVVGPNPDAAARVQALGTKGFRGRWIADGPTSGEWDMLSAVDIAAVAPYAVTGAPDAVDTDGNIEAMQVGYSNLVPLLVTALAQALDRIDALEAATP